MFYVFSFPHVVYVGTLNLIASIPGPSILTFNTQGEVGRDNDPVNLIHTPSLSNYYPFLKIN